MSATTTHAGEPATPDTHTPETPTHTRTPLLDVRDIGVRFGGVAALQDLNFSVAEGAVHAVVGPNGAGKTTAFNCITRTQRPASGDVLLRGTSLLGVRPSALPGMGVMRTFQHPQVCKKLSVLENALLGYHSRFRTGLASWFVRSPDARADERAATDKAYELLGRFDLAAVARREAGQLPFAALKRIELVRALMADPQLLLLDEPAAGLTTDDVDALGDVLRRLNVELGITVLLIEHHLGLVGSVAHRVTVLANGRTLAEGTLGEVKERDDVREAFLGKARG